MDGRAAAAARRAGAGRGPRGRGPGGGSESDVAAVDAGQPEPTVTVLRGRVTVGLRRLPSQVRPGPEAPGFKSESAVDSPDAHRVKLGQ